MNSSKNDYNNNDYNTFMYQKKNKLSTTSIFKYVGESNRNSPDQTYSNIVFFI